MKRGLTIAALLLGAIALFGDPYRGASAGDPEPVELTEANLIEPWQLARELVEGRTDLRVLEIGASEVPSIAGAEVIASDPLDELGLDRAERIVLVGDEESTRQLLARLRQDGYPGVLVLRGGASAWRAEVLHPELSPNASPAEVAEFQTLRGLSLQLGGEPIGGEDLAVVATAKPRPKLELPDTMAAPGARKKKMSEGC